jgi:hypothetical protein
LVGLGKFNDDERRAEQDARMRSLYHHSVDSFPDKIDEFFVELQQVSDIIAYRSDTITSFARLCSAATMIGSLCL